jgi:hypothetical protein
VREDAIEGFESELTEIVDGDRSMLLGKAVRSLGVMGGDLDGTDSGLL